MPSAFAELEPNVEPLGSVSDFVDEFMEVVHPHPLFAGFTQEETAVLSRHMDCYGVPPQSVVIREGDEGDFMAILVTGRALLIQDHAGVEKVVGELQPGEMIGEMSLVDGQKRYATCIAAEPSDFAVLTRHNLDVLLFAHPRLGNKLLMMLLTLSTGRLREAAAQLPSLIHKSV
jgi:CRP-like cAMP-binding protein